MQSLLNQSRYNLIEIKTATTPILRDTFDIDSENIETPPIQRKAFRHKSFRLSNGGKDNGNAEEDDDNVSDIGSDFSGRRKSTKFRTLTGDGKPLGDRELMLKKNSGAAKSVEEQNGKQEAEEEPGLFDRCEARCKICRQNYLLVQRIHVSLSYNSDLIPFLFLLCLYYMCITKITNKFLSCHQGTRCRGGP